MQRGMDLRVVAIVAALVSELAFNGARPQSRGVVVRVGSRRAVSQVGVTAVEPYIAADPSDAARLVVSVSEADPSRGLAPSAYVSVDSGKSWTRTTLPGMRNAMDEGRMRLGIDTWVAFAPDGMAYYSLLGVQEVAKGPLPGSETWGTWPTLVFRSSDGGQAWQGPTVIRSTSFDAPRLAADSGGRVYVALRMDQRDSLLPFPAGGRTQIALFASSDSARSFSPIGFVGPDALGREPASIALRTDGVPVIGWYDHATFGKQFNEALSVSRIWAVQPASDAASLDPPRFVGEVRRRVYHNGNFSRLGVEPVVRLASDRWDHSPYRGRLYAVWNAGVRDSLDIFVARSEDGGRFWSEPVSLHRRRRGVSWLAAIAASPTGAVGVTWDEPENDSSTCWRIYFSTSIDGALTFSSPVDVAGHAICSDTRVSRASTYPGYAGQDTVSKTWNRGGHYFGLAAAADGSFHPVWSDVGPAAFRTFTTRITVCGDSGSGRLSRRR